MAALDAVKGGSTRDGVTARAGWPTGDDRQSRVRAGLSLLRVLPAAPVARPGWRPPGAPWSYDLNAGATSPWDDGTFTVRVRAHGVAELLFGHQTPCMLPRSFSGVLGDSGGLCGPPWPWVKKRGHGGVWVFGPHSYAPYAGGVLYIGRRTVCVALRVGSIQTLFSRVVLCCTCTIYTTLNGSGPNHGPLKTT